jgi:hypothetical protein
MKICALLVPREHKVEHTNPLSRLSDEQLDQAIVTCDTAYFGGIEINMCT